MKKIIIVLISIIFVFSLVFLGTGCKESAATETTAAAETTVAAETTAAETTAAETTSGEPVVIKVWKGIAVANEGDTYYPEWIRAFESSHPGVTIEWTDIPWETMKQQFDTAFAAGDPPDIFYSFTGGYVDDVMEFCADYKEIYTPEEYAMITDGISESQLATYVVNGKQVGIPFYGGVNVFYWNKGLFEAAGLDPEKGPDTWEDVLSMAKVLTIDTNKDGKIDQWGYGERSYESGAAKPEKYLWQAGFNLLNADRTGIGYDDEGAIAAFEYVEKLWQTEKVAVPIGLFSGNTIIDAFYQQKFAMWFYNSNILKEVGTDYPDLKLGGSIAPAGPGINLAEGRGMPGGWGCWSIAQDTKNLELVKEFLYEFFTNPQYLRIASERVGATPASSKTGYQSDDPFVQMALTGGKYSIENPFGAEVNEVLTAVDNAFQAVQLGQLSARDAWTQAVEEGNAVFK